MPVCLCENCVRNPSSRNTILAEAEGTNVPIMSPGTSPLPSVHSKSACVIRRYRTQISVIVAAALPYLAVASCPDEPA